MPVKANSLYGNIFFSKKSKNYGTGNLFPKNVETGERFTRVRTPFVDVVLNHHRGLAIESLAFPTIHPEPLVGTIKHGYFEEISLSADWYSASTVLQRPGKSQITDLGETKPVFSSGTDKQGLWLECSGTIATEAGLIHKRFIIHQDIPQINLEFTFDWKKIPLGSFRSGFVTLLPEAFDQDSLFYAAHNGGSEFEIFQMDNHSISHGAPSSSVVTASSGLGATEGMIIIGDNRKGIVVYFDQTVCAAMPMVSFRHAYPSFFARLMFSLGEMDESRRREVPGPLQFVCCLVGIAKREPN